MDFFLVIGIPDLLMIIMYCRRFSMGQHYNIFFHAIKNLCLITYQKGLWLQNISNEEAIFGRSGIFQWNNSLIKLTSTKMILSLYATYKYVLFLTHLIRRQIILPYSPSINQLSLMVIMEEIQRNLWRHSNHPPILYELETNLYMESHQHKIDANVKKH